MLLLNILDSRCSYVLEWMPHLHQAELVGDPAAVVELNAPTVKKRSETRRRVQAQHAGHIDEPYLHASADLFIHTCEVDAELLEMLRPFVVVGC